MEMLFLKRDQKVHNISPLRIAYFLFLERGQKKSSPFGDVWEFFVPEARPENPNPIIFEFFGICVPETRSFSKIHPLRIVENNLSYYHMNL